MTEHVLSFFSGLWLCPDAIPIKTWLMRSALMFLDGNRRHYILRFNYEISDGEIGMTYDFVWDYEVNSELIRQHPVGYPDSMQIEIPWRAEKDGALLLELDGRVDRFYPSTLEQMSKAGFDIDNVKEVIEEMSELGRNFREEALFPTFAPRSAS